MAPNFLVETDPNTVKTEIQQLVQYLLSIDEDKPAQELPSQAGSLGPASFRRNELVGCTKWRPVALRRHRSPFVT